MAIVNWLALPEIKPANVDIGSALFKGMLGPMQMQQMATQNAIQQQKLEEYQDRRNALQQYGQTGDITPIAAISPELATQALQFANARVMSIYEKGKMFAGNDPEKYPAIKSSLESAGVPQGWLPSPDKIKTPADMDNFWYKSDLLKAQMKRMEKGPVSVGAGGIYDPISGSVVPPASKPTTILSPSGQPLGQVEGNVKTLPQPHQPQFEYFSSPDDPTKGQWVQKGTPPPPGMVPKAQVIALGKETEKKEDKEVLAKMLIDGEMPPKILSKRGDYNSILSLAKKLDPQFSPAQSELKWHGAQRWLSSLSSPQQARLETAGVRVVHTIDRVRELSEEMKLSGFMPLNYAEIESKMKLAGNTKEGQLATQYVTAVNDLKEIFSSAANGGYAPTESVWKLASKQINENFGVKQMGASLDELKRLMNININAGKQMRGEAGVWSGTGGAVGTTPAPAGQAVFKGGGADYYNSFKAALRGPNAAAALERAKQLNPEYINRARQEGLIQ